jgi:hypothetical protein
VPHHVEVFDNFTGTIYNQKNTILLSNLDEPELNVSLARAQSTIYGFPIVYFAGIRHFKIHCQTGSIGGMYRISLTGWQVVVDAVARKSL